MTASLFKRKSNRLCIWPDAMGWGLIPLAVYERGDDVPVFETAEPRRTGDEAIVFVEGQRRRVVRWGSYLIDAGTP